MLYAFGGRHRALAARTPAWCLCRCSVTATGILADAAHQKRSSACVRAPYSTRSLPFATTGTRSVVTCVACVACGAGVAASMAGLPDLALASELEALSHCSLALHGPRWLHLYDGAIRIAPYQQQPSARPSVVAGAGGKGRKPHRCIARS